MTTEEKNWLVVLKRIASIAGKTVPELLNDTWQCHSEYCDSIIPFSDNKLSSELIAVSAFSISDSLDIHNINKSVG